MSSDRNRHTSPRLFPAWFLLANLAGGIAHAVPVSTFELRARLATSEGETLDEQVIGSKPDVAARAEATFENSDGVVNMAAASIDYGLSTIDEYVATFSPDQSSSFGYLGDTRWVAKTGFELSISFDPFNSLQSSLGSVQSGWAAQARTSEKYAIWAMAPGSVQGYAPLDTVDLGVTIQFYSDDHPLDFGNYCCPPFGDGPYIDFQGEFHDVIAALNLGHYIAIDLDAMGVLPGESYGFVETYATDYLEGEFTDTMFITIDPVVGVATPAPEPGVLAMAATGLLASLAGARARRRRRPG